MTSRYVPVGTRTKRSVPLLPVTHVVFTVPTSLTPAPASAFALLASLTDTVICPSLLHAADLPSTPPRSFDAMTIGDNPTNGELSIVLPPGGSPISRILPGPPGPVPPPPGPPAFAGVA